MKLDLILVNCIILLAGITSAFAPPNSVLGFRISATLKGPYVWKETNKRMAVIFGFLVSLFNVLLIFFGNNEKTLWLIELIFLLVSLSQLFTLLFMQIFFLKRDFKKEVTKNFLNFLVRREK